MDDSSVDTYMHPSGGGLRRQSSDTNLADGAKFGDTSKQINDKGKRGKSPFSLFKKPKSRDPSPAGYRQGNLPAKMQVGVIIILFVTINKI